MIKPEVRVLVVDGPIRGQELVFQRHDTLLFGRDPGSHVRLPEDDLTVSRNHFVLEVNPPVARLRDLGSLNGTFVNDVKHGGRSPTESPADAAGREFPYVDLQDGDVVRVGEHVLEVKIRNLMLECAGCGLEHDAEDLRTFGEGTGPLLDLCSSCYSREAERLAAAHPLESPDPAPPALDPQELLQQMLQEAGLAGPGDLPSIPGFQLERMLGRGGFGAVYLAKQTSTGRRVAIKIMLSEVAVDEEARKRFLREIEVTKELKHPRILNLIDYGSSGRGFYFATEYCESGDLFAAMNAAGGKLSLDVSGPLLRDALDAIAYAHERQYVHRDLKPPNILLTTGDGRSIAKVADFGLAKNFSQAGFSFVTKRGTTIGSWDYMPREQLTHFRDVRPVSDVYSLAATFYHVLTGRPPRPRVPGQDPIQAVLSAEAVPIRQLDPDLPKELASAIDRSLRLDAGRRFQNAGEFREALIGVL